MEIAKINVRDPKSINLKIHSAGSGSNESFVLNRKDEESDDGKLLRRWTVQRKQIDPFTRQDRFGDVGAFELTEQELTFAWNMGAPSWAHSLSLQYCLLEISRDDGKQQELCRLSQPKIAPPAKLADHSNDIWAKNIILPLAIKFDAVDDPKTLRLDLDFRGFDQEIPSRTGLKVGDVAKFPIQRKDVEVDFEIKFECESEKPLLVVNTFTTSPFVENLTPKQIEEAHLLKIQSSPRNITTTLLKKEVKNAEKVKRDLGRSKTFGDALRDLPKAQARLKKLQSDAKASRDEIAQARGEVDRLSMIVDGYRRVIAMANQDIKRGNTLLPEFEALQKSVRIGYALYIEIQGQKIYLARSEVEPEPSSGTNTAEDKAGDGK